MHCGSLSQGFAECLQKETKQVTDAEKAAPGYLSHQVPANATETQGERLKSHPTQTEPELGSLPKNPEVLLLLSVARVQEEADQREDTQNHTGSEKQSHTITGAQVKDGESFNENTGGYEKRFKGGYGRFLLEHVLSLLFPLWFKKLLPSNLLNICFSELRRCFTPSFRLCSALLHYNNLGSPSSSR